MQDRVSQFPGRVLIIPEDGSPSYYAISQRADMPITAGTALNKANLMDDTTEANIWPSASNRTINQALLALSRNPAFGTCLSTSSANPKTVNIPNFVLRNPVFLAVTFTNQPDTYFGLNVTSTGTKEMRFRGEVITSSMIPEGYTAFFVYEGTYYRLLNPFGVGADMRKSVWFMSETGSLTVPQSMRLKLTAIGQGGSGGNTNGGSSNTAGQSGGGGGGCVIDERIYTKNSVINFTINSVSTSATCSTNSLNIAAGAGGAGVTAPSGGTITTGGVGGTATGGNIANYAGGAGMAGSHNTHPVTPALVNGCAGGGCAMGYNVGSGNVTAGAGTISCGNGGISLAGSRLTGNGGSYSLALFGGCGRHAAAGWQNSGGHGGDGRFIAGSGGDAANANAVAAAGGYGGNGGNAAKFYDYTAAFLWYGIGGKGGKGGNGYTGVSGGGWGGNGGSGAIGGNGGDGGSGAGAYVGAKGGDGGNSDMMMGLAGVTSNTVAPGQGGRGGWSVAIGKFPPIANYGGGNYIAGFCGLPLLIIEEV